MPWQTDVTIVILPPESNPGDGTISAYVELTPGETADLHVLRTDAAGAGDDWGLEILGSPDLGIHSSTTPLVSYRILVSRLDKPLLVTGPFSWALRLANFDASKVDLVGGTLTYKLDGVSL